jgi:hypothetical protein
MLFTPEESGTGCASAATEIGKPTEAPETAVWFIKGAGTPEQSATRFAPAATEIGKREEAPGTRRWQSHGGRSIGRISTSASTEAGTDEVQNELNIHSIFLITVLTSLTISQNACSRLTMFLKDKILRTVR